jgi:tRNA threonylcarbamoyladenosine biosynthesis protein TsaB
MLLLAVDTSTKAGSVAVLRDSRCLAVRATSTVQRHASGLFEELEVLLDTLHIPMTAFDLFAVASGPGSFTGLRVGLTAVKGWSEALGRPAVPVSSLEAIAVQALPLIPKARPGTLVIAVQDARRGQVFGRAYRLSGSSGGTNAAPLDPLDDEVLLTLHEFLRFVAELAGPQPPVFVSPAAEAIQAAVQGTSLERARVETVSGVLAPFIGEIGYTLALHGDTVDALHLDANYVRRTDAELKWKDRTP